MYAPKKGLFCPLVLVMSEFYYEICDDLSLDRGEWAIPNIKFAQLYGP